MKRLRLGRMLKGTAVVAAHTGGLRSSIRRLTVALSLAGLLGLVFLPVQATASHVHCGDEITEDTTFDSDVLGCSSPALTVTGNAVTLDLNGHILEGGISTPISDTLFRTSLVIENGTVRNGTVTAASVHRATIRNLHATGISGLFVDDLLLIEGNQVSGDSPGCGISMGYSGGRVFNNEVRGCAVGLQLRSGPNFGFSGWAAGNVIEGNGVGVVVGLNADGALLERNTIRGNSGDGVLFGGWYPHLSVRDNRITDNGGNGIATLDESTLVSERNVISRNAANGISLDATNGVSANDVISHNGLAGIDVRRWSEVRLSGDLVSHNRTDGIHLEGGVSAEIADVRADRNGDDGLDIDSGIGRTTLARNHAWFNGDLGIEAVPGTIDGGGNWAKHNGNPLQCLNVACSTEGKPTK